MTAAQDRFIALQSSIQWNGVDFVELDAGDPTILRVHFLNAVTVDAPGLAARIEGGDSVPTVPLAPIDRLADWSVDTEGRPLLTLHALGQGDFSDYRLAVVSPFLDRMFSSAVFSFKAFCPSDFDCLPPDPYCPPDDTDLPPIDYLAKDFGSFRRALLEFGSLRYPSWQERSEADFGVMFAEALSAIGDELSYQQDRVAAEAGLETATQRNSLVQWARLVDYEPRPATCATTVLMCDVAGPPIPAGARVSAGAPDGAPIPFEIGTGIADTGAYPVNPAWNWGKIVPYWWDDKDRCLPRGATEMWVAGHGFAFGSGVALLIQTDLPGESIRQVVRLSEVEEAFDPLFAPAPGAAVTRIAWRADDALKRERDLTATLLGGNLLPATQGLRLQEEIAIDVVPLFAPPATPIAIARRGPNASDAQPDHVQRLPLRHAPLAYLAPMATGADAEAAPDPEIAVRQISPVARTWSFSRSLLEADALQQAFTVDPVAWRPVAARPDGTPTQWELDGDHGATVRFGDGAFGLPPKPLDLFEVEYRVGLGAAGNVAADSITQVEPAWAGFISGARNPFAATDGADAESAEHVRRMAPQAFRARQFRAVRREDYKAAAEELPWVQQAGSSFRWTGSWLTVFTAADPAGTEVIEVPQHLELIALLNRRRLAGYESYAPEPRYVSIDLRIEICVAPDSLPGDVEQRVLDRLGSAGRPDGGAGFFFADRFTFGSPLYRSVLETAVQDVPGVAGVRTMTYRRRGTVTGYIDLPEVFGLAADQILRIDNDPDHPERGVIRIIPEGGR